MSHPGVPLRRMLLIAAALVLAAVPAWWGLQGNGSFTASVDDPVRPHPTAGPTTSSREGSGPRSGTDPGSPSVVSRVASDDASSATRRSVPSTGHRGADEAASSPGPGRSAEAEDASDDRGGDSGGHSGTTGSTGTTGGSGSTTGTGTSTGRHGGSDDSPGSGSGKSSAGSSGGTGTSGNSGSSGKGGDDATGTDRHGSSDDGGHGGDDRHDNG